MIRRLVLIAGAVAIALALWAFCIEPGSLRNENHEIALPNWPSGCDGLTVAVLADLHVGSPLNGINRLDRVISLIQRARPDLILLAGDYVIHSVLGGRFVPPEEIARALGRLSAPMGVWAVLGNHDQWFDARRVQASFEAVGIGVLDNRATLLRSESCAFWLVGIGDYWTGTHDVSGALAQVADSRSIVAVTHNPDVFPEIPPRVSLTIAGHTHGGQVFVPIVGRPVVPSRYGERFAIGHIVEDGRHLFVSPGVGTSILPVRFFVPPEISVLVLCSSSVDAGG